MSTNTPMDNPVIQSIELAVKTPKGSQDSAGEVKKRSIHVQLLGKHIDLSLVSKTLSHQFFCQQYKDALFIDLPRGNVFLFDYGVVVFWSVIESKRLSLIAQISKHIRQVSADQGIFDIHYALDTNSAFLVRDDLIHIANTDVHTLLSISHALAQSSKLEHFESVAQSTINEHSGLTDSLATKGKIPLSRKALSIERGKLFKTKSDILLHFNLLDTPEYFWQYPEQESLYAKMSTYLELKPRVNLLNLKLTTINELLDMLATEQHHKYAASLEWIIIILIAVDILVYFIGD